MNVFVLRQPLDEQFFLDVYRVPRTALVGNDGSNEVEAFEGPLRVRRLKAKLSVHIDIPEE